ncbi:MAG: Asp-tRNA(Asn)/Glu-tRNA(Gln) amidotransferase subunit GatC [Desulfovibrionaceae bacterium]
MKITADDVAKIATLARLSLDPAKCGQFAGQFENILDYMETLGAVDTAAVEPLYSPAEYPTVYREDAAENRRTPDQVLSNAPEDDGRFFVVPKIV